MANLVCESCIAVADEEMAPDISSLRGMSNLMIQWGADIDDHICDQLESGGDIQCRCACHPMKHTNSDVRPFTVGAVLEHKKQGAYWAGKRKDLTSEVQEAVHRKTHPHQYLGRDGKPLVG